MRPRCSLHLLLFWSFPGKIRVNGRSHVRTSTAILDKQSRLHCWLLTHPVVSGGATFRALQAHHIENIEHTKLHAVSSAALQKQSALRRSIQALCLRRTFGLGEQLCDRRREAPVEMMRSDETTQICMTAHVLDIVGDRLQFRWNFYRVSIVHISLWSLVRSFQI